FPLPAAVGRPVHAAMVLLVEVLAAIGGHDELVDALAEVRVLLAFRHESGANTLVPRRPAPPAVGAFERADGADAHPHPIGIVAGGDDRMEDEPTIARLPLRPAGVVRQALDV